MNSSVNKFHTRHAPGCSLQCQDMHRGGRKKKPNFLCIAFYEQNKNVPSFLQLKHLHKTELITSPSAPFLRERKSFGPDYRLDTRKRRERSPEFISLALEVVVGSGFDTSESPLSSASPPSLFDAPFSTCFKFLFGVLFPSTLEEKDIGI